jgi:hypothetical protein
MIIFDLLIVGHPGHVLQFLEIAVGGSPHGSDTPVDNHITLAGLVDHGLHRRRPLHSGDFDPVIGAIGKRLGRSGQGMGVAAGDAFFLHEIANRFQYF